MAAILERLKNEITEEIVHDEEVDSWWLMGSAKPVLTIIGLYLWFCLYQGPKWMEKRKPFDMKWPMIIYNIFQVAYCIFLCSLVTNEKGAIAYLWNHTCNPLPPDVNPFKKPLYSGSYWYFLCKVFDLMDTIFFVLRKKKNQVTVLHVYHHSNMVLSSWAVLKYLKGEQVILGAFINCVVHIIMYSYYLLAAMGPSVQKYLWWKKYLTRLQLVQFFIIISQVVYLIAKDCSAPRVLSYYMGFQATVFTMLFLNFYFHAYVKNEESSPQPQANGAKPSHSKTKKVR